MPRSPHASPADQQLLDHLRRHGCEVSPRQLEIWRQSRLLPGNVQRSLGQGCGSTSQPPNEAFELVVWLAKNGGRGRRPATLALEAFADDIPVPEGTVRAAFHTAAGVAELSIERTAEPGDSTDPQDRAANIADQAVAAGLTLTIVPARMRWIDERIAKRVRDAGAPWPPAELAAWDKGPTMPERFTSEDFASTAVMATLLGGPAIAPEALAQITRAMQPSTEVNPLASLLEHTFDASDDAPIFGADGGMNIVPAGDMRDQMRDFADTMPLADLHAAWKTAADLRDWGLDLCGRVETELDAGQPGQATQEWRMARALVSGTLLAMVLRDRHWTAVDHARRALLLLVIRRSLRAIRALMPGGYWYLLDNAAILPPCARPFLGS